MGIRSEYLDLAIALAVVFFLASLVVSGLNEGVQRVGRLRSKFLWAYLHDLADQGRNIALPKGAGGIINLLRDDKRPSIDVVPVIPGPAEAPPTTRVLAKRYAAPAAPPAGDIPTDGGGPTPPPGQPADLLQLVARALAPITAPELKKEQTSISHVPPASLAQAFLEVFADIGRTRLDEAVADLADCLLERDEAEQGSIIARISQGAARECQPAFLEALGTFVEDLKGGKEAQQVARSFADGLAAIPGAHLGVSRGRDLETAALEFVLTTRAARAGTGDIARPTARIAAQELSSVLLGTLPEGFARQRIDVALASLGDSPIGPTARRLWEAAEGNIDDFRTGLEKWFDSDMSRLSGYYRRSIRVVLVALALFVALSLNIDSLQLARDLWRNPEGRASLVAQADELRQAPTTAGGSSASPGLQLLEQQCRDAAQAQAAKEKGKGTAQDTGTDVERTTKELRAVRTCVNDALNKLSGLNLVDRPVWKWKAWTGDWRAKPLLHGLGLLITMAALALGAPFWFDLLKRLTGIRSGKVGRT